MSAGIDNQLPVRVAASERRVPTEIEALGLLDSAISVCEGVGAITASQALRMHRVLRESQPWNRQRGAQR